jgi:plastocyanin
MGHPLKWLVGASLLGFAACGGSSTTGTGGPVAGTCTPGQTSSVGLSATGALPKAVCVQPGGSVTFTNGDTVAHEIQFTGASCPAANLGPIAASQSAAATFPAEAICNFRDAAAPGNVAFQGTVAVSTGVATGPGY